MIKYVLVSVICISIFLFGSAGPGFLPGGAADPVPQSQKVAHSSHCAGCHGFDEAGKALVDAEGNDVNIYDDWQISMMALSSRDPFWRATLAHEVHLFPSAQAEIENTCLRCHAPLGSRQAQFEGAEYSYAKMLTDSLGLDGVSCSACHQQPEQQLGRFHSGHFLLDTSRRMFGPYPDPFQGPMQLYVGFDPVFGEHIYSSGICAGCHTLITHTLDETGTPTGDHFVEQATYHEWLNSVYSLQSTECQTCHLPFITDSVVIASDFQALGKRYPFGLHQFFGANTVMLDMMRTHRDTLGIPDIPGEAAWDESIQNNRANLLRAAKIEVASLYIDHDTLYVTLSVTNRSGHKLPTGYPSRLAWLQVLLTDQPAGDTLYLNGAIDDDGHITGRDIPYEPHHEICSSAFDVQIYEMVMSDRHGHTTTRLNAAQKLLKDNRLLPQGFRLNHPVYDTVAVRGSATGDPDYSDFSAAGKDRIEYRIALPGNTGTGKLEISLLYQTIPPRWLDDMFSRDTISDIGAFRSMYAGYESFVETINRLMIEEIDLSTSSTSGQPGSLSFHIFPNPLSERTLHLQLPSAFQKGISLRYEIYSIQGQIMQTGIAEENIRLEASIAPGVYYFLIRNKAGMRGIRPLVIL